jgi:hypothetical protein
MKYEKPELFVVGSATGNIQSGHKGDSQVPDNPDDLSFTIGAYEADE